MSVPNKPSQSDDASCKDGATFGGGVVRQILDDKFVLVCDVGFETSQNYEVKCRDDGRIDAETSAKCSLPPKVEESIKPIINIRKIRSVEHVHSGKKPTPENGSKKRGKLNDDSGRRPKRRKVMNRRRKNEFQADEGASAIPGEAVQWRPYGSDVVGMLAYN